MPMVFREGGLRYYFFSDEGDPREPLHIQTKGGNGEAKFWIDPSVRLVWSAGFTERDLSRIGTVVDQRKDEIRERWNDHFGD